jgi:outer membrane protein OmpA-like peptidoglycan-associated protein
VKTEDLTDDWVYAGTMGRAQIKQSGSRVILQLTWTPNTDPSPHYRIDATVAGRSLNGTWRCVTRVCNGQGGKFHADIDADANRLVVSQTEDPGGTNGWNTLVLTRAPSSAERMAKALDATGVVQIYDIFFDTDQTAIKPESKSRLDEVSKLLKNNPSLNLEVAGHTDNTGTHQHNVSLSKARATAVVRALVETYGISAARLHAMGYGDTKPFAPNDTERNRANNRRVELRKL